MTSGENLKATTTDQQNDKPAGVRVEETQPGIQKDVFHIDEIDVVHAESMVTMRC